MKILDLYVRADRFVRTLKRTLTSSSTKERSVRITEEGTKKAERFSP